MPRGGGGSGAEARACQAGSKKGSRAVAADASERSNNGGGIMAPAETSQVSSRPAHFCAAMPSTHRETPGLAPAGSAPAAAPFSLGDVLSGVCLQHFEFESDWTGCLDAATSEGGGVTPCCRAQESRC